MPSPVPGDKASQDFGGALGAVWAGGSDERPPEALDAAIIFAPVGAQVPAALAAVKKGGCVVCGGIHMSDITRRTCARLFRSIRNASPKPCAPSAIEGINHRPDATALQQSSNNW
jgi:alcohol dehydrogenase, propanol-preferring